MNDPRSQAFREQYAFQTRLIHHQVDGVTDEESLLQLPFEANCLNWVLGHIIARRHSAIEALGEDPFWSEDWLSRYRTGSAPIQTAEQAIPFQQLLEELDRSMSMLQEGLHTAGTDLLDRAVVNDRGEKAAAEHLDGFLWHETFHIGQLDLLQAFTRSRR